MAARQSITLRNGEEITLTEREMMFCNYYLGECNKNATQSAIKAGYSERTAATIANQNLRKLHIQKLISDKTAPVLEAMGMTTERMLQEWAMIALSNPNEAINEDSAIPIGWDVSHKFRSFEGQTISEKQVFYKTQTKVKAMEVLSEYLGIINRNQVAPQAPQQVNLFQQINNYIEKK